MFLTNESSKYLREMDGGTANDTPGFLDFYSFALIWGTIRNGELGDFKSCDFNIFMFFFS